MAVVNRNSTQIANVVANPPVQNNAFAEAAHLRSVLGYVANAADDSANSIHRIARLPSNCNVRSIKLSTGDASTAGAINLGLYYSADNPASATAAVIDVDLFGSAIDLTGGPFIKTELVGESGEYTIAEQIMPLWQAAGLSADPGGYFDLAATISTTYSGAAVGQLFEVAYVQ